MVMMAFHMGPRYLTVRHSLPIPGVPEPSPEVFQAIELGFGPPTNPMSALSFDDWPT